MRATLPLALHGLLLTVLLAACVGPNLPGMGRLGLPVSPAVVFTDAVTKIRAQSLDEISAGRLFAAAVKGLETAPPKGAIRVTADERSAQLAHGESGSADATLAVSLRATATPADVGAALDEAARFAITRLGTPPTEVVDAMLRGLMTVDPAGSYISAAVDADLKNPKSFGGVGLELTIRHGVLRVVSCVPGSPAQRAGLRATDHVVSIDGAPTAGIALPDVIARLRGAPGSEAVVSVSRPEWGVVREFRLIRVPAIPMAGVDRKMLEGIGYVKVRRLQGDTASEVSSALAALRSAGARAIVLDLRGNSGGLLIASIQVAELFLESNRLVTYTHGRVPQQNLRFSAHASRPVLDLPLAVLVSETTAAGAEIIGAALQDWGRATVVGARTFGLATIQTAIPLANGGALRLTTTRWFTPKGRSVEGTGLTLDTEVADDEDPLRVVGEPERDVQLRGALSALGALTSR